MALIPRCYSICFIYDFECVIDASLEWEDGEPVAVINDVLVHGHSLPRHSDHRMVALGGWLMDAAEDDETLIDKLVEDDCIAWTGRGPNDPDGRYVRAG